MEVNVRSALALPGWYVNSGPPKAPVLVQNPKQLPSYLKEWFPAELTQDQTAQVQRYLRRVCEDVEYQHV